MPVPVPNFPGDPAPIPPSPPRWYEQIEGLAKLYSPAVYDQLTTQLVNWKTQPDPQNSDFVPLTDVPDWSPRDAKIFVVGIIPPSAEVTGRLLDRSATVQAQPSSATGVNTTIDLSGQKDPVATPAPAAATPSSTLRVPTGTYTGQFKDVVVGFLPTIPGYSINLPPDAATPFTGIKMNPGAAGPDGAPGVAQNHSAPEMYNRFLEAYRKAFPGEEPTPTQLAFLITQSRRENNGNWKNNNPGNIGAEKATSGYFVTGNGRKWKTYPDAQAGADAYVKRVFENPNTRAAAANGDVSGYLIGLAQTRYYEEPFNEYYGGKKGGSGFTKGPDSLQTVLAELTKAGGPIWPDPKLPLSGPDSCAFKESGVQAQARRVKGSAGSRFNATTFYNAACPLAVPVSATAAPAQPTNFAGKGSEAAQTAQKAQAAIANKDLSLNDSILGKQLLGAQKDYIDALQNAIEVMRNTPPLRMLVNPISFNPSEEKIISDGNFSRGDGPVVEHWGEQQTKISASGKLAAFYALDAGGSSPAGAGSAGTSPGLTRMARNFSESYKNFLSLYLLYRNNGTIWLNTFSKQNPGSNNLALVGSIYIYYDDVVYFGAFDSFTITETDDKPYSLEYSYEFTVRAKFELDRIPDPLEGYGNDALFAAKLPDMSNKSIKTTQTEEPARPVNAQNPPGINHTGLRDLGPPPNLTAAQVEEFQKKLAEDARIGAQVAAIDRQFDSGLAGPSGNALALDALKKGKR